MYISSIQLFPPLLVPMLALFIFTFPLLVSVVVLLFTEIELELLALTLPNRLELNCKELFKLPIPSPPLTSLNDLRRLADAAAACWTMLEDLYEPMSLVLSVEFEVDLVRLSFCIRIWSP